MFQCIMVLGDSENCSGGWYSEYFVVAMCIYSGWCCLEMFTGLSEILNIMGWAIFLLDLVSVSIMLTLDVFRQDNWSNCLIVIIDET